MNFRDTFKPEQGLTITPIYGQGSGLKDMGFAWGEEGTWSLEEWRRRAGLESLLRPAPSFTESTTHVSGKDAEGGRVENLRTTGCLMPLGSGLIMRCRHEGWGAVCSSASPHQLYGTEGGLKGHQPFPQDGDPSLQLLGLDIRPSHVALLAAPPSLLLFPARFCPHQPQCLHCSSSCSPGGSDCSVPPPPF